MRLKPLVTNVDTTQGIVVALEHLLAERQDCVLRLEALAREQSTVRKQLAELEARQELLLEQLKEQIGPPAGKPLSPSECVGHEL